jgi:hypothetical protein
VSLLLTPREELLWLAALLDGEGCFTTNGQAGPNIVLGMTDEDTVRTAHERAGVGNVTGPLRPQNQKHKPFWRWKVSDRLSVFALCKAVLPYMSARRSRRIETLLAGEREEEKRIPIWVRVDQWER